MNLWLLGCNFIVFSNFHKLKIPTFASLCKPFRKQCKENETVVNAARELLSQLLIAARKRKIQLPYLFVHELSAVPLSLFHPDGSYQKTDKSNLSTELEKCSEVKV